MNTTAVICTALLALLLFGLGMLVSMQRFRSRILTGAPEEADSPLGRAIRAHGNTAEYAPVLCVLILYLGAHDPSAWVVWMTAAVTACRYLIVIGLLAMPMDRPNPARFLGALGTYVFGVSLSAALLIG